MKNRADSRWGFVTVWEFRPRPGMEAEFEKAYGSNGIWAQLFVQEEGFIATELNRDLKDPSRYLTLDFWVSRDAFERFRDAHVSEYQAIDQHCEALTAGEKALGMFERL
jgi:heme-degrading monooxygenase HmoA